MFACPETTWTLNFVQSFAPAVSKLPQYVALPVKIRGLSEFTLQGSGLFAVVQLNT